MTTPLKDRVRELRATRNMHDARPKGPHHCISAQNREYCAKKGDALGPLEYGPMHQDEPAIDAMFLEFQEGAAILEFDQGLPRAEAEKVAFCEILRSYHSIWPGNKGACCNVGRESDLNGQ